MNSFLDKLSSFSLPEAVGIVIISIPGYIFYKEVLEQKISETTLHNNFENLEESFLESKIRSESLRPGPEFIGSHIYRTRRAERVKSAYNSVWVDVNHNLDMGNRKFNVQIEESDEKILNVVKNLLVQELFNDGYTSQVQVEKTEKEDKQVTDYMKNSDNDFYFNITVE